MKKIVVVHNPKTFTLGAPGVEVVSSKDYLTQLRFAQLRNTRIFNLSRSFAYQSRGYYVSLLAEARGQKVIPSAKTLLDLHSPRIIKVLSRDLDEVIQQSLGHLGKGHFNLSVYFGRNVNPRYDRLAHQLYMAFETPLMRAHFVKRQKWELKSLKAIAYKDIGEEHIPLVKQFATEYFSKKRYDTAREDRSAYDLAILVNREDKAAPSNKRAIVKFRQAAEAMGFRVDIIGPGDIDRLGEYDALLIRENTYVNNHTWRMSRKAQQEGLAVIDAPDAIVRCNNKVYLAQVMETHRIPTPRTMIVHSENRHSVGKELGFPIVLKLPDSTFSIGVEKAHDMEELEIKFDKLLADSDLVIAQEYMPSEYDWRVGILDGKPLYVCKYYMAPGHWQIYNWNSPTKADEEGSFDTVPVNECPAHIMDMALKGVKAMVGEQGLFGVDIKEYKGKAYLIEVNECPNIDHGVEDVELGDEIYRRIIGSLKASIERRIGIEPGAITPSETPKA